MTTSNAPNPTSSTGDESTGENDPHGPDDGALADHGSSRWSVLMARIVRSPNTWHVAILGLLAYVPTLLSSPGRMVADTKLYLYLDPSRLTGDALYSWDSRQFAGWVPHQTVSYLWPSGPWYSFFSSIGVPDWIAQRLWIATLMFAAGLGVRWAAKLLGIAASGALVAALFYQLSPYLLPYISRTSTMLLPWAGLGWVVALTIRAATRTKWRDIGLFGLVIATISPTNATAILMIAPAPVLWLLHAAWERSITWRTAIITAVKLGAISVVMSAWWISMLSVQGKYGADVLGYSETLEAVSLTSSSTEVVRGLGYWLFYVRDPYGFLTAASNDYMASGRVIAITFLIFGLALIGLVATRWSARRFAILLVFVGVVLAVSVHPIADPSPLMSPLADNSRSSIALAMRSSTRAIPLSAFGFALGIGALSTAIGGLRRRTRFRLRRLVPVALGVLAVVNLPIIIHHGFADPILQRDQDPPAAWEQAADALDAMPAGYRVMQVPGLEFGAYRWGYTSDPPLPGMTNRPLVTRDLLPLGNAGAMDLLYAFDDRFQDGSVEASEIAPIARLFGVDTVWLPNDVAFDRYRTPRPEDTSALFATAASAGATDLGPAVTYGEPTANVPLLPMVDEESISNNAIGEPLPAVALVPVEKPLAIVRAKTDVVVVAGSGDGVIDAAASGVLTGDELIRYAADLTDDPAAISGARRVVVTDSNRDRAHHWHSSQDVWGFTEDGSDANNGQAVLVEDTSDQRIPVFVGESSADQTIAEQRGGTGAAASGYGEPFAYRPENRPAMAVDGDLSTAWVVADRYEPVGEFLRLTGASNFSTVHLVQPQDVRNRWITRIDVTDAAGTYPVDLSAASRTATGQDIALRQPSSQVTITIAATEHDPVAPLNALDAVGFAEATTELGPTDEVIRVPSNVLPELSAAQDLDIVLSRLRTRATNRWRSDPEPVMTRSFTLADARDFVPSIETRLDLRAADSVIATLLGWQGTTADRRLTGVPAMGGWAATDGDPTTSWTTPFGPATGSTLTIPLAPGQALDPTGVQLTIQQSTGDFNTITDVTASDETGATQTLAVPAPDAAGASTITVTGLGGASLRLTIAETTTITTTDRRYAEQVLLPAAISEVSGPGIVAEPLPTDIAIGCRDDLLQIDGAPVAVRMSATVADLFAGRPATTTPCDDRAQLAAGEHMVRSANGATTGIDVDRIVLRSDPSPSEAAPVPAVTVVDAGRVDRTYTVAACPDGCWFVFGEGYNQGWAADIDGDSLGVQQQVDGGFNGWYLPPSANERTVHLTWNGQARLTAGIGLSALGVLGCIALIVFDRRRRPPLLATRPRFVTFAIPPADTRWASLTGPAVAQAATALAVGALVISPTWGIVCALVAAVCGFGLRRAALVGPVAVAMLGAISAVMLRRFLALKPFANAGWPGSFEDLHRPTMTAIVLLAVSIVVRSTRPSSIAETPGTMPAEPVGS
ncbi:MAG: alpha-(1-_3)-arabinofuranosyltransferase family protein [Ilumatobacteraceae bacterium]